MYLNLNSNLSLKLAYLSGYKTKFKPNDYRSSLSIRPNKNLKQDMVSISSLARSKNKIESLNKQKQKLMESKNDLITRTLESWKDVETIKEQLETFDNQVKNIEEQISKIIGDQLKSNKETGKKLTYEIPKTKDQLEKERLNQVVDLSLNLNKAKNFSSIKKKLGRELRTLESEIKLDESRGVNAYLKRDKLANLDKNLSNINDKLNERTDQIKEKLEESKKPSFYSLYWPIKNNKKHLKSLQKWIKYKSCWLLEGLGIYC